MYKRYRFDNGIRVVLEHIPYVNSISIGLWIKSGSRFEDSKTNGVSHFIEHMLFKGTKKRSARKIAEEIEELGGQLNAFTGKEATCFYVKLIDEHYDIGINVLSDMLLNSLFSEEEIEKEKKVIIEEIKMYEDTPEELVSDILSIASWENDPLSYPILGTEESIKGFNRDIILDYFNSVYVPENLVISVAGNFEEEKLIDKLNKAFRDFKKPLNRDLSLSAPIPSKKIITKSKDIEQVHFSFTLKGIEIGNELLYALFAVNNYFGGGTSSRLFQRLREENGFVYTIYSYPSAYKNCGIFNIYFALNENHIDSALKLINKEIDRILKKGMNSREINKAKEQLKGNYILGLESISSRMFGMGKAEIMLDTLYEPKEILNKIDAMTDEEVNRVIRHVFSDGIIAAAAVGRNIDDENFKKYIWR